MQNREEVIIWLTEHEYVAFPRDWSVGESIAVAKRVVEGHLGIRSFEPTLVWIYPDRKGGWLIQPPFCPSDEIPFGSLAEAVAGAVKIVDGWEAAMALEPEEQSRRLFELCGIKDTQPESKSEYPCG